MTETKYAEIEIDVAVDEDGTYVVDDVEIGELNDMVGEHLSANHRVVRLKLKVALPTASEVELTIEAEDHEPPTVAVA